MSSINSFSCGYDQEYGINIISVYDLTGRADSYLKVTCPQVLNKINIHIKGSDLPFPHKKTIEYMEESCCLPF